MRILHTSDWHLGRLFHGASLLDDQAAALDRIVEIARDEAVELVIVAGDIYDRAIPPAQALQLFHEVVERLADTGAGVAAISGNHDSSIRLGGHDALLNKLGIAIRGDHRRLHEPIVIERPADGGSPVSVHLLPYLEPAAVASDLLDDEPDGDDGRGGPGGDDAGRARPRRASQDLVTRAATRRIRRHLAGSAPCRSIVVAHTFVAGGEVSESERDLSVGHVDRVGLGAFDGFDLVALGHLHTPQRLDGDRIAYAGSILPYSFSEEGREKSVRLVDLAPDGSVTAAEIPIGAGRPVRTVRATLDQLLTDPAHAAAERAWVRALLTDRHLPDQAAPRLRARFPHLLELRHEPDGAVAGSGDIAAADELRRLEPLELVLRFWDETGGGEARDEERDLFVAALDAGMGEDR